jgi:hypothetical protein
VDWEHGPIEKRKKERKKNPNKQKTNDNTPPSKKTQEL